MVKRVGLVSSGTGGHLWPALVLGDALRAGGYDTVFLTAGRAVESELLSRAGQRAESLEMTGRGVGQFMSMARGTFAARRWLAREAIDAVVCTGGRTSVAAGLAARSLRLPIAILEQNAVPGRANRLLSRMARRVYLGLPTITDVPHSLVTGTPIRKDFSLVDRQVARQRLGLREDLPVVLVTGGSQGASFLNEAAPRALLDQRSPLQIVHLSGPRDEADVRARYRDSADQGVDAVVRALAFDMPTLYAAADLVICRGGGCTVAELIATGRAALIVPYPHHRDQQQLHNARVLARAGAAVVMQQQDLTGPRFTEVLQQLLRSPERLRLMEECARSLDLGDACDRIVHDLEKTVL